MNYEIRWVAEEDADALGNIHSASWRAAYKGIIPDSVLDGFTPEKRAERFRNAMRNKNEETSIILVNSMPAGFITLGKCRDEDAGTGWGEIWGIYMHPDYWHSGIGSLLFNWGLEELGERGFDTAALWVLEGNSRARKFYEKHGFEKEGTSKIIQLDKELREIRYILYNINN